jgi:hypothetical protein
VKLRQTQGAARLHTKTVEELSRDAAAARANAGAADKGKMTKNASTNGNGRAKPRGKTALAH